MIEEKENRQFQQNMTSSHFDSSNVLNTKQQEGAYFMVTIITIRLKPVKTRGADAAKITTTTNKKLDLTIIIYIVCGNRQISVGG